MLQTGQDCVTDTGVVQFDLSNAEIKRLQALASGDDADGFVTEQDAMTSYFLNMCRLQGLPFESVTNSVNVRAHGANVIMQPMICSELRPSHALTAVPVIPFVPPRLPHRHPPPAGR